MLNTVSLGPDAGVPLIIAHGLFGSARNWGVIQKRLSDSRHVIAVDMRNHGDSPWSPDHGYGVLAQDLAQVIDAQGGVADVLGHSMGGKAAMRLALDHPEMVRRLVVADIAPVAYGHTQMHLVQAMQGMDLSGLSTRSEADRRLAGSVETEAVRAFLLQSLDLRADPPRWKLNLQALARQMSRILGWEGAGRFDAPALFLSGAVSDYVLPKHHREILQLFPQAQFQRLQGAGHWLHAEKPREFEAAVRAFLD